MNKTEIINKISTDPNKRILLSHIFDLSERRNGRNVITASDFLSEPDVALAEILINTVKAENYVFFGGYGDAERKCAVFLPDYYTEDDINDDPSLCDINYIEAAVDKFNEKNANFSHRDVLGSLMGLGIERDLIGDILADGGTAVFAVKSKIVPFITENLVKISRYPVTITVYDKYEMAPKQDYVTDSDTVASMRLDAVISSVFSISRSAACDAINGGLVSVNGIAVTKSDRCVNEGDKLSLRGKGKAVIDSVGGFSKKGRIRFSYRKYR